MKKNKNITQLTAKQFAGVNRQAVALGKSILAQEGKVLTEWLALGRLVLITGVRQVDIIKMLNKKGVKMDKSDLNKAVACAKWNPKNKNFASLNAMYEKAPRKQKSGKRARRLVVSAQVKNKRVTIGDFIKAHKKANGNLAKIVELLA